MDTLKELNIRVRELEDKVLILTERLRKKKMIKTETPAETYARCAGSAYPGNYLYK